MLLPLSYPSFDQVAMDMEKLNLGLTPYEKAEVRGCKRLVWVFTYA